MSKVYFLHTTKLKIVKEGYVPAATIAIRKNGDNFEYGVAICSKYDNFSKKYGREVAENRLNQGFGTIPVPKVLSEITDQRACLMQLYNLSTTVVLRSRKWKKRITKFNLSQKVEGGAKVISINQPISSLTTTERA